MADDQTFGEAGTLVLDQRFAIVPEWIIDAEISDCAFRLYAVLLRYGQTSGQRMPGRALLARRLHKSSKDTVDRALKELVALGAVTVERRRAGQQNLTNRYHLHSHAPSASPPVSSSPGRTSAATPASRTPAVAAPEGASATSPGRTAAATPGRMAAATPGRTGAARPGRTDWGRVAAPVRPDPEVLTQREPPPAPPATVTTARATEAAPGAQALLAGCGIGDLDALATRCHQLRVALGQSPARWAAPRLVDALRDAVTSKGLPAARAAAALMAVAADPASKSPMRLGCPGPWWDTATAVRRSLTLDEAAELDRLEVRLREADGRRVWLQQRARADLTERGQPVTRLAVARLACHLLDQAELIPC